MRRAHPRAPVHAAGRVGGREHGRARGQARAQAPRGDRHLLLLHRAQQRLRARSRRLTGAQLSCVWAGSRPGRTACAVHDAVGMFSLPSLHSLVRP